MAKTRLEWLEEELVEVTDILDIQFIERDIAMVMQDQDELDAVHDEIRRFMRRKEAIAHLISVEKHGANFEESDFRCTIIIHNEFWEEQQHALASKIRREL